LTAAAAAAAAASHPVHATNLIKMSPSQVLFSSGSIAPPLAADRRASDQAILVAPQSPTASSIQKKSTVSLKSFPNNT